VGALVPTLVLAVAAAAGFVLLAPSIGRLLDSEDVATGMRWAAPGLFCFALNKVLLGVVNGLRRMRAFAVYSSLRYLLIAGGLALAAVLDASAGELPLLWTFAEGALLVILVIELVATVRLRQCSGWSHWIGRHVDY